MNTNNLKEVYISPRIQVILLALEQGIAAGSATLTPTTTNDYPQESWDNADDDDHMINW